jgi:hypothetical protein
MARLQVGEFPPQSLSDAHSHRLVVALQVLPPSPDVQMLPVQSLTHSPRRVSQVCDLSPQTSTVAELPNFFTLMVSVRPKQLALFLSNAHRPTPSTSTQ